MTMVNGQGATQLQHLPSGCHLKPLTARWIGQKWGGTEIPFEILTRAYISEEIRRKNQFHDSYGHSTPIGDPGQAWTARKGNWPRVTLA
jgi:hypothetical protein